MPLRSESSPALGASDSGNTEEEMRRALGLDGGSPSHRAPHGTRPPERHTPDGQKRRFVQDGEVPVFVVQGRRATGLHAEPRLASSASPVNRLEIAENALRAEREARAGVERSLAEAQGTIHDLQTALGHAMLARDEAQNAMRRAEGERQAAEAALTGEREAREQAEAALLAANAKLAATEQPKREARPVGRPRKIVATQLTMAVALPETPKRTRGPAKPKAAAEPKPVRWWIKPKAKKAR